MQPCRPAYKSLMSLHGLLEEKSSARSQIHPTPVPSPCFTAHSLAPTCKAHPTPFLLKCKSCAMSSLCLCAYSFRRQWVYGYKWVCDAHHTQGVEKSLWRLSSFKANQESCTPHGHQPFVPVLFHALPGPLLYQPHFLPKFPGLSFPISFEAFGRHLPFLVSLGMKPSFVNHYMRLKS